MRISCEVKDYKILRQSLNKMSKAPKKAIERTMKDVRERVPGWVATEVTKVYGIKKSEISGGGSAGSVKVIGTSPDNVAIQYRGRTLTPIHFNMAPNAAKPGGGAYTLKATILKGSRKPIGHVKKLTKKQKQNIGRNFTHKSTKSGTPSPYMLMDTGAKSAGKTQAIPFQRTTASRLPIEPFRTLSLPQMVSSERTEEKIYKAIDEKLGPRIENHIRQMEK